jgi:hypothetical protein
VNDLPANTTVTTIAQIIAPAAMSWLRIRLSLVGAFSRFEQQWPDKARPGNSGIAPEERLLKPHR